MNDERLMVLKMIQDGKITPEQGESLLRALPADTPADVNQAPPPPPSPNNGNHQPGHFVDFQGRLADVQVKLAELQSKLGAASTPPPSSSRTSVGSKPQSFIFSEFNVGQMIDEAVRNVNGLKSESVRTFKLAARTAQREGRRIKKEAKKTGRNLGIDFNFNFGDSGRPKNVILSTEKTLSDEIALDVQPGQEIKITNLLGDVKLCSSTGVTPSLKFKRTAWSSDIELLEHLQTLKPVVNVDGNGRVQQIVVVAEHDDLENITIDIEVCIPDTAIASIETSYGDVCCEGRSNGPGKIETHTGAIRLSSIRGNSSSEGQLVSRSGSISVSHWDGPSLSVETISGSFFTDGIAGESVTVRSRSGDISFANVQLSGSMFVETSSGEIDISTATVAQSINAKSQSGNVCLKSVRPGTVKVEAVSGDVQFDDVVTATGSPISVETVSGDICTKTSLSSNLTAVSISGDIDLTICEHFGGSLMARAISGDVFVKLAQGADAKVELTTQTGSIERGVVFDEQTADSARFVGGRLEAGSGSINLQSVSGDVTLKSI